MKDLTYAFAFCAFPILMFLVMYCILDDTYNMVVVVLLFPKGLHWVDDPSYVYHLRWEEIWCSGHEEEKWPSLSELLLPWLFTLCITRPHVKRCVLCQLLPNLRSHTKINSPVLLVEAVTSPNTPMEEWQGHTAIERQVGWEILLWAPLENSICWDINRGLGSFPKGRG